MRTFSVLFLIALIPLSASGQSDSLKIEDLAAPVSPGFQILGISPQEISRPRSVTALQAYFINSVSSPGALTDDFALEFSPYWLQDRPALSFNCYYELESCDEKEGHRIFRSFSISVASTGYETKTDSITGRNWGVGGKITLKRGEPGEEMLRAIRLSEQSLNLQLSYSNLASQSSYPDGVGQDEIVEKIRNEMNIARSAANTDREIQALNETEELLTENIVARGIDSKEEAIEYFTKLFKGETTIIRSYLEEIQKQDAYRRVGLNIDVAFGSSFVLPENDLEGTFMDKYGIWLTSTYTSPKNPSFSFALLVRRLMNAQEYGSTDTDLGLSFALEKSRFTTNLEGIWRYTREEYITTDFSGNEIPTFNEEGTYRFTWNSTYKLTDDFKLNLSLGKNYDSEIRVSENFIAVLGIGIDLFKQQYLTSE